MRFEFVIDGPPVSQQARRGENLRAWRAKVRSEAEKNWPQGQPSTSSLVMLQIVYFYTIEMDVDNIAKPIQDALKGLVYIDDDQIIDLLVSKRELAGDLRIDQKSITLAEGFARGNDFLYIAVVSAFKKEIPILW